MYGSRKSTLSQTPGALVASAKTTATTTMTARATVLALIAATLLFALPFVLLFGLLFAPSSEAYAETAPAAGIAQTAASAIDSNTTAVASNNNQAATMLSSNQAAVALNNSQATVASTAGSTEIGSTTSGALTIGSPLSLDANDNAADMPDEEDLELYAQADAPASGSMHRMYNPNSGEHFYTAATNEKDHLIDVGWIYEGIGWIAPAEGDPVYRLYNKNAGDHHYTLNASERDYLVKKGWRYEGIGWKSGGGTAIYREYNPNAKAGAHNFTASSSEHSTLIKKGWRNEKIAWYAEGTATVLYRMYNRTSGEHFYTSSGGEKNALKRAGWKHEGVGWIAPGSGDPVFRLYNNTKGHYYTVDETERDNLVKQGWKYEGIKWYSGGDVPVYHEYNASLKAGSHNFTTSKTEHDALVKSGWQDKGIAWYAVAQGYGRSASEIRNDLNISTDIRSMFNHGKKGAKYQKYIVLHDTEGDTRAENILNGWASNGALVAAHFIVNKDGSILQCGNMDTILHHAGYGDNGHNKLYGVTNESRDDKRGTVSIGSWARDYGMNSYSIGIEMVHVGGAGGYPQAQLDALDNLIAYIDAYYGFESKIIDHKAWRSGNSDTSPEFARYLRNYQRTRSWRG